MEGKSSFLQKYVIKPVCCGFGGFMLFLGLMALLKLLSSWLSPQNSFSIDSEDVLLSMVGFVLMFLIDFLKNFTPGKID